MPELGKKTSTVMALRMIVQSGLTAKEIQAVLPTLRDLREAEKTFKKRAEQLLDEEKNALLAARPGGPMPPDTGEKLHDAAQEFGEKSERTWQAVTREIGGEKAHMLRQLVQGVMGPGMGGGPAPGGFDGPGFGPDPFGGRPGPGQPGRPGGQGRPGRGGGPGGPPPSQTPQPGQPNAFDPFVPDSDPLVQVGLQAPGAPGPGLPAIPGTGDTPVPGVSGPGDANVTQAPPGARNAPRGGYGQQGRPGDQLANPQNRFNRPRGQGNPGPFTPQPDGGGFPMMGGGPRISVGELVELLEQRLAAMPK